MTLNQNFLYSFSSKIMVFIFTIFYHVIIARILSPSDLGVYTIMIATPLLIGRFSHLGVDAANAFYVKKKENRSTLINNSIGLIVFISLLLNVGYYVFFTLNNGHLENFNWELVVTCQLLIVFSLYKTLFLSLLVGEDKLKIHSAISTIDSILPLIGLWGLYIFGVVSPMTAVMLITLSYFLTSVILHRYMDEKITLYLDKSLFIKSFKYGAKSWINNIANQLNYKIDVYIILFILGPKEVGIYAVAVLIIEKSWFFSSAICNSLFPKLTNEGLDKGAAIVSQVIRLNSVFICILSVVLGLFSKSIIILLFSSEYLASQLPLIYLIPGIIFLSIPKILVAHLAALNKLEYAVYSSIVSLVTNISLNLILIPTLGIKGAAIASSISYGIYCIFEVFLYCKLTKYKISQFFFIEKDDIKLIVRQVDNLRKKITSVRASN